jgi:hypothetical protein
MPDTARPTDASRTGMLAAGVYRMLSSQEV